MSIFENTLNAIDGSTEMTIIFFNGPFPQQQFSSI